MNTFLTHKLAKLSRYIYKNQNVGTIPEHRILMIDGYKKAKSVLFDKLNREPSAAEMADHMNMPIKTMSRLEKELSKQVITSDLISSKGFSSHVEDSENDDILDFVYYDLSPEQKIVYEYSLGINGKKELSGKAMAKKLKMSPSKITRIKNSIAAKMKSYKGF